MKSSQWAWRHNITALETLKISSHDISFKYLLEGECEVISIMCGAGPVTQDYSIGDNEKKWLCCGSLGQAGCWENLVIAASENNGSPIPPLKLIDTAQGLFLAR